MTMPGGRWKATLTRVSMGGHDATGQPIESRAVIWNNVPAYFLIKKTAAIESPTGITSETQYVVVLPWLEENIAPLPNDTISVRGYNMRVMWVEQDHLRRHLRLHAERTFPVW